MSNQEEIQLTEAAVQEVKRMLSAKSLESDAGLRMLVKGGGCSGLSYHLDFDKQKDTDHILAFEGLKVLVDPKSFLYLKGTTLDYADSLQDKGFKFINPNAAKTCGCGESFSV